MAAKTLKKRCTRCGVVRDVRARQRRCHERRFGPRSYCCWGTLKKVERAPRATARKETPMATNTSTENAKRRPQDVAAKKLEQARKKVSEKTRAMARLATQLRQWERRATYYAKRASMTDAEIAAETAARLEARANRKPKRRAIKIGG